jgi:hypothetical protein
VGSTGVCPTDLETGKCSPKTPEREKNGENFEQCEKKKQGVEACPNGTETTWGHVPPPPHAPVPGPVPAGFRLVMYPYHDHIPFLGSDSCIAL